MTGPLPAFHTASSTGDLAARADLFRRQVLQTPGLRPFAGTDTTVGVENEFQAAVEGAKEDVDLAIAVVESNYYQNLVLRARRGDLSPHLLTELKKMGLMVSINSNASLIDDDWLDFFRHEPPARMNITLSRGEFTRLVELVYMGMDVACRTLAFSPLRTCSCWAPMSDLSGCVLTV